MSKNGRVFCRQQSVVIHLAVVSCIGRTIAVNGVSSHCFHAGSFIHLSIQTVVRSSAFRHAQREYSSATLLSRQTDERRTMPCTCPRCWVFCIYTTSAIHVAAAQQMQLVGGSTSYVLHRRLSPSDVPDRTGWVGDNGTALNVHYQQH